MGSTKVKRLSNIRCRCLLLVGVIVIKKNNMNGIIWGILNFIFPIVGMIIYLIVRASKKSAQTKCDN